MHKLELKQELNHASKSAPKVSAKDAVKTRTTHLDFVSSSSVFAGKLGQGGQVDGEFY